MKNLIQPFLQNLRYIKQNEKCYLSARVVGNWGIWAFVPEKKFFHIKISMTDDLQTEFQQLKSLFNYFNGFMVKPLGFHIWAEKGFLVNQGLRHDPFSLNKLLSSKLKQNEIIDYFLLSQAICLKKGFQHTEPMSFALTSVLQDEFHIRQVETLSEQLLSLGSQKQHSDFVVNNLAFNGDKLIIFDWEDYGKIQYPGFDLAILFCSLFEFNMTELFDALKNTAAIRRIATECFKELGLELSDVYQFMPLYLYSFLYLKHSLAYSEESIKRTERSIQQFNQLSRIAL